MEGLIIMANIKNNQILKVSAKSDSKKVAGAIAALIREDNRCVLQCVGAGAINQGVKAIAIARGYSAPHGHDIVCIPAFDNFQIDGEERTYVKLIVECR